MKKEVLLKVFLSLFFFSIPSLIFSGGIYVFAGSFMNLNYSEFIFLITFMTVLFSISYVFLSTKIKMTYAVTLIGLVALQLFLMSTIIRTNYAPSHNHDASNHYYFFQSVLKSDSVSSSSVFLESNQSLYDGTNLTWYPLGYHVSIASLCSLLHRDQCIITPWLFSYLLAAFWSVTMFFFCLVISRNSILSLCVSAISLTYFLFPYTTLAWGQWGILSAQSLMPWIFALRIQAERDKKLFSMFLYILCFSSLFYIHSTTFLTMLLIMMIYEFYLLIINKVITARLVMFYLLLAVLVGVGLFSILGAHSEGKELLSSSVEIPRTSQFSVTGAASLWLSHNFQINLNFLIVPFLLVGLLTNVKLYKVDHRIFSFIFITLLLLTLVLAYSSPFASVFKFIYPWGAPERILSASSMFFVLLSGIGLYQILKIIKGKFNKTLFIIALTLSLVYIFNTNVSIIAGFNSVHSAVTIDDVKMFSYINSNISSSDLIYQNPRDDAGAWLNKFTKNSVLFPLSPAPEFGDNLEKLNLFLISSGDSSLKYNLLSKYNIKYIFKGSTLLTGGKDYIPSEQLNERYIKLDKCFGSSCLYKVLY